jgi:hypothetical protein
MRRKGHPSRPRAITCCFFASLKTLLIPTKATALRRNQRPRASFSLAGFEVTLIGRFWVTPEVQTPHRFRSKRQRWTYSGLGIETHDSAQYRYVGGQVQRSKKPQQIRGLNQKHNHEMKEIFKSTATRASCATGPFRDFYAALLTNGMKPEMARLTLARKIAAITLTLWKKEEGFDAEQLKTQAA